MKSAESPGVRPDRPRRVVSLPCGHHVDVDLDASLLAVSGPVWDHQATCRAEEPLRFAAWFPLESPVRADRGSLGGRPILPLNY